MEGAPTSYSDDVALWTGTHLLILHQGDSYRQDRPTTGALFDPLSGRWSPISTEEAPSLRSSGGLVWTGTELILWSGFAGSPALRAAEHRA
jgi:hypothetical protein